MTAIGLQDQCEQGQRQLMAMDYLSAETTLAHAAERAWEVRDFDTLGRVYLPLQEARRQRRQRAGEGIVCLDLLAQSPDNQPDAQRIAAEIPHGQLLLGGWGSVAPALALRKIQSEKRLFVETFLAAVYPVGTLPGTADRFVALVPLGDAVLPPPVPRTREELIAKLPPHCLLLTSGELPHGRRSATAETYGQVMAIWERLHTPFLAAAEAETDPIRKIQAYRLAIQVDYACELAHQGLADTAKHLARHLLK